MPSGRTLTQAEVFEELKRQREVGAEDGWSRADYMARMECGKTSASLYITLGIDNGTIEIAGRRLERTRHGNQSSVPLYRFTAKLTESLGCGSKTKAANR